MVNLTKKIPCRRNDLIYAYDKEGRWEGGDEFFSYYDSKKKKVYIYYWWHWECFEGNVDDCIPGTVVEGEVTASG